MRIILVGYSELAASLLIGLLESKHKIVGIMRWEKSKGNKLFFGLKNIFWPDRLTSLIKAYKVHEIEAESINSSKFHRQALKLQPDIILIGSWGEILQKKIIMLPKTACVNCHPSLLPKHRGPNPYTSTILNGETKTGITFHLVDEKLDTGPILLQKEVAISNDDTGGSLRTKCSYQAKIAIKELLEGLENAQFLPQKQNEYQASYFPRPTEKTARINWNNPAQIIHNQIRGTNPWLECYTKYKNQFFMLNTSKIIELKKPAYEPGKILYKKNNRLIVSTADNYTGIQLDNVRVYGFLGRLWSTYYINEHVKIGDYLESL